ncbi:MAG: cation-translocating P-type ATPase [Candidatus Bathyarchaeota archaeon]|nr:cation-translocating P-type ATPase [Candidatus Termiticorpusculum sp.]
MTNCKLESGGLTANEVKALQLKYGKNELSPQKKDSFAKKALHTLCEPMFLLLIIAAIIYFILGEPRDGAIMLIFVIVIISIDIVQEWKTDKTLNALKDLSAPYIKVIRDRKEIQIASIDLVPGDVMMIYEGVKIPADGFVISCNDLRVDESSLTGEAEGVWKVSTETLDKSRDDSYWRKDYCYAGTLVIQGSAIVCVDKIGKATEYGKIGVNVAEAPEESTPLQKQTGSIVKLSAGIAAVLFALVSVVTWFNIPDHIFQDRLIESILSGITLAMAMIPEEFPVILTVFLSMGAWRLAKKKSLVRKLPSVETLGAVSVLCVDKTGTITMNQMTVQEIWATDGDKEHLSEMMGLACETNAYDPMEKAMLDYCEKLGINKKHLFGGKLITEYAFTDELKMMGHIWHHDGEIIIAAKGSPERILTICQLTDNERALIENKMREMSKQGLRVIAVATTNLNSESDIPKNITDCSLTFCGLIGLVDPPRESVKNDIAICNKAGIRVVMITGDSGITAAAIAKQIGMTNYDNIITGDMLEKMTDNELRESVKTVSIFSRVIPEHKMRIVKAFKDNGEIVAMTGDGVNDAPALKYADIGIAMGKRGSEVSREAADLILMNDNFSTIVDTVSDGRRIYDNIRKAVGYVFTIHIPIALISLLAPLLGIYSASLMLLPLHVVLLELIIDPTCSIVLERQPAETNIMERRPRNPKEKLLNAKTLTKSVIQGIAIFAVSFGIYYFTLSQNPDNASVARSMGLAIIMLANLFLVQVNSSDRDNIITSIKRLSKDKIMWAVNIFTLLGLFLILYTPLNEFLKLAPLSAIQILTVLGLAAASVLWYEIVKLIQKIHQQNKQTTTQRNNTFYSTKSPNNKTSTSQNT